MTSAPADLTTAALRNLTTTLGAFAAEHLAAGRTWPFEEAPSTGPASAVCQVHCHQRSTGGYDPELHVLSRLGIETTVVGGSCCGIAGNWGFGPGHYELSQALGERTLFPTIREASADAFVLADGFSCRTQITQGTSASPVHLAEIMHARLAGRPATGTGPRARSRSPRPSSR